MQGWLISIAHCVSYFHCTHLLSVCHVQGWLNSLARCWSYPHCTNLLTVCLVQGWLLSLAHCLGYVSSNVQICSQFVFCKDGCSLLLTVWAILSPLYKSAPSTSNVRMVEFHCFLFKLSSLYKYAPSFGLCKDGRSLLFPV